ncbi:hypothetical protein Dip510_000363 [Elusimicrobium posterum]|uniref:DUF4912 domain-containing protein n=1 Tax=Elusimicrobium posterum TaxID=3116653 RepID=UPI003C71194D
MDMKNHNSTSFVVVENREKSQAQSQLPTSYGRTEAFLLPKDPNWVFLFWEITGETYEYIKSQNGFDVFDRSKTVVRLHDTTGINFDGYNSNSHTDINIVLSAGSWYIRTPETGRNYTAEVGLLTPEGRFILIARSNNVIVAPGRVSEVVDEKWMTVEGNFEKLLAMSGAKYIGMGASELAQVLADRWRTIETGSSFGPSSNMSSKSFMQPEEDDMWLRADCEIIIYGEASPGATVKINGQVIELTNGSFSIRQSLQKGDVIDLPIVAEKNGMTRRVKIKADRED